MVRGQDTGRTLKGLMVITLCRMEKEELEDEILTEAEDKLSLERLEMLRVIGTGTFARVCLCHVGNFIYEADTVSPLALSVQDKTSKHYYALKILTMAQVIKLKQVEHVINEKEILREVRHPFIVSLVWSHKDSHCLYMLFPYICGGELFSHLRQSGKFISSTAQFYAAEIVSALEYLHSLSIIYRDLKPENLLIDKEYFV